MTETKYWLNGSSNPVYGGSNDDAMGDVALLSKYEWVDPVGTGGPRELSKSRNGATTSTNLYDDEGHLYYTDFEQYSSTGSYIGTSFVHFQTDMSGQITDRSSGGSGSAEPGSYGYIREHFYRFGGQAMGEVGNNGSDNVDYATLIARRDDTGNGYYRGGDLDGTEHADFDVNHVTMAAAQGGSAGGYTARGGESLQQVARAMWGDSALWYKLAEANGLSMGSVLSAGQRITVPAGVVSNTHNASSFQPYDPAKAIGDLTPGTVVPPPAQDKNCGLVGAILLAAVAIAATVVTAGAALAAAGAVGLGSSMTIGAGISAVMAGGVAGAAGSAAGAIALGAVGGAAGSAISQGFGNLTGLQDGFSWKSVAMAGISGGVSGGMGRFGGAGGLFGRAGVNEAGNRIVHSGALATINSPILRAGIGAATGSALSQGIGDAVGVSKFNFAGVAAAGVGAMASYGAGSLFGTKPMRDVRLSSGRPIMGDRTLGNHLAHIGTNAASTLANAATRSALSGGNFGDNVRAAIPDLIAQALQNVVVHGVHTPTDMEEQPTQLNYNSYSGGASRAWRGAGRQLAYGPDGIMTDPVPLNPDASDRIVVIGYLPSTWDELQDLGGEIWNEASSLLENIRIDESWSWSIRGEILGYDVGSEGSFSISNGTDGFALSGNHTVVAGSAAFTGRGRISASRQHFAINGAAALSTPAGGGAFAYTARVDGNGLRAGAAGNFDIGIAEGSGGAGLVVTSEGAGLVANFQGQGPLGNTDVVVRAAGNENGVAIEAGGKAVLLGRTIDIGARPSGPIEIAGFSGTAFGTDVTLNRDGLYIGDAQSQQKFDRPYIPVATRNAAAQRAGNRLSTMNSPHLHHVVELNGRKGVHRAIVRESQGILWRAGINPLTDPANLVYAPNLGHTKDNALALLEALRAVDGDDAAVRETLYDFGQQAQLREARRR